MANFNQEPLNQAPVDFPSLPYLELGSNAGLAKLFIRPQTKNFAQVPANQLPVQFLFSPHLSPSASVSSASIRDVHIVAGFIGNSGQKIGLDRVIVSYPDWRRKTRRISTMVNQ